VTPTFSTEFDEAAKKAATGRYLENGLVSLQQQRNDVKAESKFRPGEDA